MAKELNQFITFRTQLFGNIDMRSRCHPTFKNSIIVGNKIIDVSKIIPDNIELANENFSIVIHDGVRPVIDIVIGADIRVSGFINIPVTGTTSCNCINLI